MQFGRVPAYTDIAHFRAPYKNSYFGQDDLTPPPPPNGNGLTEAAFIDVSDAGTRRLKPSVQSLINNTLMGSYAAIHVGGEYNQANLVPFTAEEMAMANTDPAAAAVLRSRSAGTWVNQQVQAGNVVFAAMPTVVALMTGQALATGADQLGTFPSGSDAAQEAA